jgi:hypothetical protein
MISPSQESRRFSTLTRVKALLSRGWTDTGFLLFFFFVFFFFFTRAFIQSG